VLVGDKLPYHSLTRRGNDSTVSIFSIDLWMVRSRQPRQCLRIQTIVKLCSASRKESRIGHTVVVKLKTSEFKILARSHTPSAPPSSCEELTEIALKLRERVDLGPQQRYRLVGMGLSNFQDADEGAAQPPLFK
jgi:hypothetical protein